MGRHLSPIMMKYLLTTVAFCLLIAPSVRCQTLDTLVDVGGYQLQFHIVKGKGMPILFETGSGDDGSVFEPILKPIAAITGAPLITYARAGFGKSDLDRSTTDPDKHGILATMTGLETALTKLGFDKEIMVIGLSYGGFCAELYAARHPQLVKTAVLIDANHVCWFIDSWVESEMKERRAGAEKAKADNLAAYYQSINLQNTVELMKRSPFPANIPVIDLVSEHNFPDSVLSARWRLCHQQFAAAQPNRQGITAHGCGHIIFQDNPFLVISAIVKAYAGTRGKEQGFEVMKRFLAYSVDGANTGKVTGK
jgi:pimeloyl-ACP methyl ester carboxylesterase